ncbi:hypothetical protein BLNAU_16348 [Blattamonas nauphoetae]|uniref:Uncharacterized protein n=1 Tax=Blattamonas nauphoetae TaxID=2049346 RepID=A0ABQ9WXJ2_9EUKA|nr:hypothetical protein BLNAU_20847 [Blattamonas nauphoetae]KAK2948710.1 hypothetical protein BLNAU_16348 [Blattamonas nauphoetae]
MTPTRFCGLSSRTDSAITSDRPEMVCCFGLVVLYAAVFDCRIVNRPLSKLFLASLNDALLPDYLSHSRLLNISKTILVYLVEMGCAPHSHPPQPPPICFRIIQSVDCHLSLKSRSCNRATNSHPKSKNPNTLEESVGPHSDNSA